MDLCERFPGYTPLSLRREKAREVFIFLDRFSRYSKKKVKNAGKPTVIRRPAPDTWF